jgi:hypothetical protein
MLAATSGVLTAAAAPAIGAGVAPAIAALMFPIVAPGVATTGLPGMLAGVWCSDEALDETWLLVRLRHTLNSP